MALCYSSLTRVDGLVRAPTLIILAEFKLELDIFLSGNFRYDLQFDKQLIVFTRLSPHIVEFGEKTKRRIDIDGKKKQRAEKQIQAI